MAADSNSDNPLDQLRLSLMQDVLPVGLAVLERARQGGAGKVVRRSRPARRTPSLICVRKGSLWRGASETSWMP